MARTMDALEFAELADLDRHIWHLMINKTVEHISIGMGKITLVQIDQNNKVNLIIDFEERSNFIPFSSNSFLAGAFQSIEIPEGIDETLKLLSEKLSIIKIEEQENIRKLKIKQDEQHSEKMEILHKKFLESYNKLNTGIRKSNGYITHRKAFCWKCGVSVDNELNFECKSCNWILCSNCGACGCTYEPKLY